MGYIKTLAGWAARTRSAGADLLAHGLRNIRAADHDAGFATVRRKHRLIVALNPTIKGRFLSEPTG